MSVAEVKTTMTAEKLFREVKKLPKAEFEKFSAKFSRLNSKPKETNLSKKEADLIVKVNECTPTEKQNRHFYKLVRKRRNYTLTEDEYQELLDMTEKFEIQNVERLKSLIKLAKIRKKTLEEVMDELGIKPPSVI